MQHVRIPSRLKSCVYFSNLDEKKNLDARYCVNYLLKVPVMQLILPGDFERVQGKLHNIRPFFYSFFPVFLRILTNHYSFFLVLTVSLFCLPDRWFLCLGWDFGRLEANYSRLPLISKWIHFMGLEKRDGGDRIGNINPVLLLNLTRLSIDN